MKVLFAAVTRFDRFLMMSYDIKNVSTRYSSIQDVNEAHLVACVALIIVMEEQKVLPLVASNVI